MLFPIGYESWRGSLDFRKFLDARLVWKTCHLTKPPPSILLAALLASLIVVFAIAAAFAMRLPNLGIDVDVGPKGQLLIVSIKQPSQPIALPATLLAISSTQGPAERIALENDHHLISETQTAPKTASVLDQDRLVAMVQNGPVTLEMRDARGVPISMQRDTSAYNSLTFRFWLLGIAGLTCAVISAWVFVLRPNMFAARAVFLIGLSLLAVSLPIAVTFSGDFIIGGTFWLLVQLCNYVGTQFFAAGVVLLLCQYPQRLLRESTSLVLLLGCLAPLIFPIWKWRDNYASYNYVNILVLVDFILIVAAGFWQWRATKHDPVGRSYVQLVGATWVIVLALFLVVFLAPVVSSRAQPLDFAISMWLMVPPFFAMAYGVGKGFMFEASTWAGRLLLSATTLLALAGVDLALIYAVRMDSGAAASGAFFIIGTVWFLGRNMLTARFLGRDETGTTGLFDQAVSVAMARDDTERASKWHAALKAVFSPLEVQVQTSEAYQTGVINGGLGLSVPALRFAPPMLLTSKRAGTQVFTKADVKTVETLKAMCERIDADRDAYDRGSLAERERIARDLHDDVSSRLLTSLHRTQPERVQADVREALSDIRSIISGLEGEHQPIEVVLSAIRIEALDRFEAAGIEASWPTEGHTLADPVTLDYRIYRNLNAVMREITSNIIRHAKATHVEVTVQMVIDTGAPVLHIEVCDNGIGLEAGHRKGNGLANITARVTEIGGAVLFDKATFEPSTRGTRVTFNLPLSPYSGGPQTAVIQL
jgi:two-component system, NarL family, sensor histidine kinase DevS